MDEDEFNNNHENIFQHYFSNNINEKYKIVYGREIPHNSKGKFNIVFILNNKTL